MCGFLRQKRHKQFFFTAGQYAQGHTVFSGAAQAGSQERLFFAQVRADYQYGIVVSQRSMLCPNHCAPLRPSEDVCLVGANGLQSFNTQAVGEFFAKYSSSTVFIGFVQMPTWFWLPSLAIHSIALRTYSNAVFQSTSIHSPPCLISGFSDGFRDTGLVGETVAVGQPAFVNRFVFQRQHAADSMVFGLHNQVAAQSIMSGNGFATVQFPIRALKRNGLLVNAPTGHKSMTLPDNSVSTACR